MNNQEPVGEALDGLRTENIVLHFVAPQSRSTTMLLHRASFRIIFARSRLTNTSPTGSSGNRVVFLISAHAGSSPNSFFHYFRFRKKANC